MLFLLSVELFLREQIIGIETSVIDDLLGGVQLDPVVHVQHTGQFGRIDHLVARPRGSVIDIIA